MVVIFGRLDDASTTFVAEWIHSFGKEYVILNTDDERGQFVRYSSPEKALVFEKESRTVNLLDVESVWVRRNGMSQKAFGRHQEDINLNVFFDKTNRAQQHITKETNVLIEYIHDAVSKNCDRVLGAYRQGDVNKLVILDIAEKCGLSVPVNHIVSKKSQIAALLKQGRKLITKPLSQGVYAFTDTIAYFSYVENITEKNLRDIPDTFFPSWLQEKVEKKYELRVFYFLGKCYSMAIFSQEHEATSTDFRRSNDETPTRHVPFQLPPEVEGKITDLMNAIHLNTGSIDIIVDVHDNYVFLEVNPVGQFAMTSYPCNYYLEKLVAGYLCEKNIG
ncbi:grasp-with-spasm system ATP-grasp peptide maturase [Chitinophaga lutea]|nr:grasp-with-spasm system ATP-grasp peptide maturase [Chitinophaga lutea]